MRGRHRLQRDGGEERETDHHADGDYHQPGPEAARRRPLPQRQQQDPRQRRGNDRAAQTDDCAPQLGNRGARGRQGQTEGEDADETVGEATTRRIQLS